MFSVKARGLSGLLKKLERHQARVKRGIATEKAKLARKVFVSVVEGSPQWSGNLAQNWNLELGTARGRYQAVMGYNPENWYRPEPFQAGDDPATTIALYTLPKLTQLKWNTPIRITNYTPYAAQVEAGQGPNGRPIRPDNYRYGQIAMVGYAMLKFGALSGSRKTI